MARDGDSAGPSLLLARHEMAHREHAHHHNRFHRRQTVLGSQESAADALATAAVSIVTDVVATISVLQIFDSNGNSLPVQTLSNNDYTSWFTVTTDDTGPAVTSSWPTMTGESPAPVTTDVWLPSSESPAPVPTTDAWSSGPAAISFPTLPALPVSTPEPSQPPAITNTSLSLPSITSAVPIATSISSSTPSFASHILSANTSTIITSPSSALTFTNSSIASARSSLTYLTSSPATATDGSSPSSITTLYETESPSATNTDGYFGYGTASATGSRPSSTVSSGNGTDSGAGSTPSSAVVAGGVVGGLAGAAVIVFLLLFLVRWKKRHQNMLMLGSGERSGEPDAAAGMTRRIPPPPPAGGMTSRPNTIFAVPAALASLTGYKRWSQRTETNQTISSTAGSERGFYRVSGRKLPSVLQTGGDGYGGGGSSIPDDQHTWSGSSFYRDSHGFYGGAGGSPLAAAAGGSSAAAAAAGRESGVPIMRPSPARTPVTEHPPFFGGANMPPLTPPRRPDRLGRSHPSQDGSHASRFTEEV